MEESPILQVHDLYKHFSLSRGVWGTLTRKRRRTVRAVDGVSFSVHRGEILALVGESGSGKTTVGMNVVGLTHDLATAGFFTDRMAVMYLGRIVELGPTAEVLARPQHPYTRALISVVPVPNPRRRRQRVILQGEIPNPIDIPPGCRFHPRCPYAVPECREADPHLVPVAPGHEAACILVGRFQVSSV